MKVTKEEIVDALIEGADSDVVARAELAARSDSKDKATYEDWGEFLTWLRRGTDTVRSSARRTARHVAVELPKQEIDLDPADHLPSFEVPSTAPQWGFKGLSEVVGRSLSLDDGRRQRVAFAALLAVAPVVLLMAFLLVYRGKTVSSDIVAEQIVGEVQWLEADGTRRSIQRGDAAPAPARVSVSSEAQANLRTPDGALLVIGEATDVLVGAGSSVRQLSGAVYYRVPKRSRSSDGGRRAVRFVVTAPQGRLEVLGTNFHVDLRDSRAGLITVESGRVRVAPNFGGATEVVRGQRARFTDRTVTVEDPLAPRGDEAH